MVMVAIPGIMSTCDVLSCVKLARKWPTAIGCMPRVGAVAERVPLPVLANTHAHEDSFTRFFVVPSIVAARPPPPYKRV